MRSWDPTWEQVFCSQAWGRYPGEHLIRFVAKNLYRRDRSKTRVLEVGCGPGANLWYLAREGFSAHGIDGSKTAVRQAQERLLLEGLKADVSVGDILKLPWPDGSFDAVIDVECLYVNDAEAMRSILAEIRRVLVPGGLLYSQTLTEDMAPAFAKPGPGRLEYLETGEGVQSGKGFMRLSDRRSISELYGAAFEVLSVDHATHTIDNGTVKTSEWIIVCRKADKGG